MAGVGSKERARTVAMALGLIAAAGIFLTQVHAHTPLQHWLFWRYAAYWVASLVFALAALSSGHFVVGLLMGARGPLLERTFLSFAAGVLLFELAMFVAGITGLFGPALFFVLPLLLFALGARGLIRETRRVARLVRVLRRRRAPRPLDTPSPGAPGSARRKPSSPYLTYVVVAFGLVGFAIVYFSMLTPDNVAYDSRWRHMAMAEDYAAAGMLRPFPEGWLGGASPQGTTLLYTWAFLSPVSRLFDRVLLSAHLELVIFALTTCIGIPALVRRLVPRASPLLVWPARFLFPGVFLYDSSLCGGADHVGALWAPAIALTLWRCLERLEPRRALLLAMALSGATLTKETVALLLVPVPVFAFAIKATVEAVRSARGKNPPGARWAFARATGAAVAGSLLLTSPHWLKNWLWYQNPVYPLAHSVFGGRPWGAAAEYAYRFGYVEIELWRPPPGREGVLATLQTLVNFSFAPHDWGRSHGTTPVFGSLFTLLLIPLLFLRGTRRIWGLVGWVHVAIACWFWVHHQDRYLQTLMPLMAAVVAAVLVKLWRAGTLARVALAPLVGLQVIWGGDVPFFPTHSMIHDTPLSKSIQLLAASSAKRYEQRFDFGALKYELIGRPIPRSPGVRLLMHEFQDRLGVGHPVVNDWPGHQFGIDYGRAGSARAAWQLLRSLGTTHLAWYNDKASGWSSLASDLVFFDLAWSHAKRLHDTGEFSVGEMPPEAPPLRTNQQVLVIACAEGLATGLYDLGELDVPVVGPRRGRYPAPQKTLAPADVQAAAAGVAFAAVDDRCKVPLDAAAAGLRFATRRKPQSKAARVPTQLFVRAPK